MKMIPDNSVQIVIADPPYNIGKDFGNNSDRQDPEEYLVWTDSWISECLRILKPNGTIYIYGFSETLSYIRVRMTCNIRWIIWSYTNKVKPTLNFFQRSHESILVCWKDSFVFNRDSIREPYTETYLKNVVGRKRTNTIGRFNTGKNDTETVYTAHPDGALPKDVIKVPALVGRYGAAEKKHGKHPTQKPLELCLKLLKASKQNEIDLVVIPFVGSGSEVVASKMLNLPFIGFELNPQYITIAEKRLADVDTVIEEV